MPERALYIRSTVAELERIHSHLLWLGLAGHFLGFNTLWMWAWRFREDLLDILELITGNRNHYGMMKPGGVHRDIRRDDIPAIAKMLDGLKEPIEMFRGAVMDDPCIHARTQGVGVLTRERAIAYGALGPTARASGVDIDVRRDHPHAAYGLVEWNVVTATTATCSTRRWCGSWRWSSRSRSSSSAWRGCRPWRPDRFAPRSIKPGEGIGHYEAPRGEVFHYIRSDGSNRPVRHKVRAPSFMNVPTNRETVLGATVADATIILAAVDPCYCCTERMASRSIAQRRAALGEPRAHPPVLRKNRALERANGLARAEATRAMSTSAEAWLTHPIVLSIAFPFAAGLLCLVLPRGAERARSALAVYRRRSASSWCGPCSPPAAPVSSSALGWRGG